MTQPGKLFNYGTVTSGNKTNHKRLTVQSNSEDSTYLQNGRRVRCFFLQLENLTLANIEVVRVQARGYFHWCENGPIMQFVLCEKNFGQPTNQNVSQVPSLSRSATRRPFLG
jgi:hypothetical protein